MNVFRNTKILKKFILVIIAIVLFNFLCSNRVYAWLEMEDVVAAPAKIIYLIENGLLHFINNIFCDKEHQDDGIIYVSPESIIKGKFIIMDPNIFKPIDESNRDQYYDAGIIKDDDSSDTEFGSSILRGRDELRNVISGWYYALRNLALVALLSILVYVGIRMLITSVSQDKAKYKTMLKDWFIALCLVFAMHYIMIGILNLSSSITEVIGKSGENINFTEDSMTIIENTTGKEADKDNYTWEDKKGIAGEVGKTYDMGDAYAQCFMLAAIIGYTFIFAFKYLKRMITIVFLILLAPITCITYPIDKISDGKAQAYNRWFQEFLYNVIIQPFHLLIYVVLVGSATTLANTNILYGIMCFAVMIPAEKLIREMFGFKDKLGSPIGAFASGALASQLMNKAFSGGGSTADKNPKVEGKSESNNNLRENKLKPGLPGSDSATGEATTYETSTNPDSSPESQNGSEPVSDNGTENPQEDNPETQNDSSTMIDDDGTGLTDYEAYMNQNSDTGGNSEIEDNENTNDEGEDDESGDNQNDEQNDNSNSTQTNTEGIYTPGEGKISKFKNAGRAIREHRDKKLLAKYGTKNRAIAFAYYAGRKGAKIGKKAIKGATTLTGAAALGMFGLMFGQGGKGALAGATLGSKIGNSVNNKLTSGYNTAKEYGKEAIYAMKDEEKRRKDQVKKMMKTPDSIERTSRAFSKRNNGKIANTKELNQELAERARFKETGLSDDQIDDAMEIYKDSISSMGDEKAFAMAYRSAKLADGRKADDFEDSKKVNNMYDAMMREYEALGVNQELADENVRDIISNAASIYGVKRPALSVPSMKDAYKANKDNQANARASIAKRRGIDEKKVTTAQLNHELEMGYNLKRAGISEDDRKKFFNEYLNNGEERNAAKRTLGGEPTEEEIDSEVERRYEISIRTGIEGEDLTSYISSARAFLKENSNIEVPSNGQVCTEIKQRLSVKDSYHISGSVKEINSKITQIRKDEEKFVRDSADKEGAKAVLTLQRNEAKNEPKRSQEERRKPRDMISRAKYQRDFLATYSSREMQDEKTMEKAKKKIIKKLEAENHSTEFSTKFATEIISSGKKMAGIKEK